MTAAAPPAPPPELAAAVRAGRWAEVRTIAASAPAPASAAVALALARAQRQLGNASGALVTLQAAVGRAGELAAALRLEAAQIAFASGQDPLPWLAPLLGRATPPPLQRAAGALLVRTWEAAPLATLERHRKRALPKRLRRELDATLAVRGESSARARAVMDKRDDDLPAVRCAAWLATRAEADADTRVEAARVLLLGGLWSEADALLATISVDASQRRTYPFAFLRGRAAYRLGRWSDARDHFDRALALAGADSERFAAAVQRARVTELIGDFAEALPYWETARARQPREIEGWDGALRLRVVLGRTHEATQLLRRAPRKVLRTLAPRLAALLLAHHEPALARDVLLRVPATSPVVRALWIETFLQQRDGRGVRAQAIRLLTERGGGPWRDYVLDVLGPEEAAPSAVTAATSVGELAENALRFGTFYAQEALAAQLGRDPAWSRLMKGEVAMPLAWTGAAAELAATGFDEEAAELYPNLYPAGSPSELAWSAHALARAGNAPAALGYGERLWSALGNIPATLIPAALLAHVIPVELTRPCALAADDVGVDPARLASIVRQESRFDRRARSHAGALGVAQIVPEAARRLGADPSDLFDGRKAFALAAREVLRLESVLGPRLAPVSAAYNAGQDVVASWLKQVGSDASDLLFAAAIPYRETSGYVLAVREGIALTASVHRK